MRRNGDGTGIKIWSKSDVERRCDVGTPSGCWGRTKGIGGAHAQVISPRIARSRAGRCVHFCDMQGDWDRGGVDEAVSGAHVNAGKWNAKRSGTGGDGTRGDGDDVLPACSGFDRMRRE